MKPKMKRTAPFLCFTASVSEGEDKDEQGESLAGVSPANHRNRWRQRSRRIVSKIARSMSSSSNSSKRKSGKLQVDRSRNGSNESENRLEAESFGKNLDDDERRLDAIFSSCSSSSSSSSTSSLLSSVSSCCSSCPAPEPNLRRKRTLKKALESRIPPTPASSYGYATWLCLLLLSLFIMIFCGRLCAILWTSSWLCLIPRRKIAATSPEFDAIAVAKSAEVRQNGGYREADKKRVVLEGLLRRNRGV